MHPEERDPAYLWDMLDIAQDVVAIIAGKTVQDVLNDKMLALALERGLEIIGEVARRVSKECQEQHPEIPWRNIIGQRNILAHEYGKIDHRQLFRTAVEDIPRLVERLRGLLPPLEDQK